MYIYVYKLERRIFALFFFCPMAKATGGARDGNTT